METSAKINNELIEVTKEVKMKIPKKILLLRKQKLESELASINSYLEILK